GAPALTDPRAVQVQFRYACVTDAEGLKVVDVTTPGRPRVTPGKVSLADARGLTIGATYAGQYAYVAAGKNGLRVVKLIDSFTPGYLGWSPAPQPELIASLSTSGPALAIADA